MDLDEDSTNKEVIPLNQSSYLETFQEDAGKKPSRRVSKRSENAAPHRASS